jgi:polyisoprenoid-binding protein YceI
MITFFLHVAGALKHVVIDRDATLRRMLPGSAELPKPPAQKHSALPALIALALWGAIFVAGTTLSQQSASHAGHDHAVAQDDVGTRTQQSPEQSAQAPAQPSGDGSGGANWSVESGTLGLTIQQMGSGVSGTFANWSADIQFDDPEAPGPAGTVVVEIDIASLSLGTVTDQAMGPDYFDSARYPTARYEARLEKLATGYQAVGDLTLRDISLPLTLPFTLVLQGDRAEMTARASVNRLDFDIGKGTQDEGTLGFAVELDIVLTAQKAN